jgi:hypothetical protein
MRVSVLTLAGVTLLLSRAPASADPIPWMYSWSRSPAVITADAPGTGYITLTDEPMRMALDSSDVVATNLRTWSTATRANPDIFTDRPYQLQLTIQDVDSGQEGSLTFTGLLSGELTAGSSRIDTTFTGQTEQSLVLGEHRYTANLGSWSPPGPPGSTNSGGISSHVEISVETIMTLPEPGSLLLAGLGATALGCLGWRRVRSLSEPVAGGAVRRPGCPLVGLRL